ncbi:MAG: T9SS type A sorting domain-containing protein, partial [Crocinitomicaceae bacterium]|nr:T9SS type A sorting domain-containing protein [Crocinitomicaceae bacterium]
SISGNTSISIYPNPAKNVLHIDANTSYSDVQILDINGRLVIAHSSGQDMLDLSGFSDGTYILTCRLNNGQEIRKRLIIRH